MLLLLQLLLLLFSFVCAKCCCCCCCCCCCFLLLTMVTVVVVVVVAVMMAMKMMMRIIIIIIIIIKIIITIDDDDTVANADAVTCVYFVPAPCMEMLSVCQHLQQRLINRQSASNKAPGSICSACCKPSILAACFISPARWICGFYLSVAARKIVCADPSLRYTRMLLGR